MDNLKGFVLGCLGTAVVGAAFFGASAHANADQNADRAKHLVGVVHEGFEWHVSADVIDHVEIADTGRGDGTVEMNVFWRGNGNGEFIPIGRVEVPRATAQNFIRDVNKYRD